jgi:hypothetical protein
MPDFVPAIQEVPSYDAQAAWDNVDVNTLAAALTGTGVVSGCRVTQHSPTADMGVDVSVGSVLINGVSVAVAAQSNVTVAAASSTDRKDAVYVNLAGTVLIQAGTPCGQLNWSRNDFVFNLNPVKTNIPSNCCFLSEIYVPGNTTAVYAAQLSRYGMPVSPSFFDLPVIDVVGVFGADPTGATDSTNAIQNAINAASSFGSLTSTAVTVTSYSAVGNVVTLTWTTGGSYFPIGSTVTVSGVTGTNINGTWMVTSATSRSVTFTVSSTPAYTSGGTITGAQATTTTIYFRPGIYTVGTNGSAPNITTDTVCLLGPSPCGKGFNLQGGGATIQAAYGFSGNVVTFNGVAACEMKNISIASQIDQTCTVGSSVGDSVTLSWSAPTSGPPAITFTVGSTINISNVTNSAAGSVINGQWVVTASTATSVTFTITGTTPNSAGFTFAHSNQISAQPVATGLAALSCFYCKFETAVTNCLISINDFYNGNGLSNLNEFHNCSAYVRSSLLTNGNSTTGAAYGVRVNGTTGGDPHMELFSGHLNINFDCLGVTTNNYAAAFYLGGCDHIYVNDLFIDGGNTTVGAAPHMKAIVSDYNNTGLGNQFPADCIFDRAELFPGENFEAIETRGTPQTIGGIYCYNKIFHVGTDNGVVPTTHLVGWIAPFNEPSEILQASQTVYFGIGQEAAGASPYTITNNNPFPVQCIVQNNGGTSSVAGATGSVYGTSSIASAPVGGTMTFRVSAGDSVILTWSGGTAPYVLFVYETSWL